MMQKGKMTKKKPMVMIVAFAILFTVMGIPFFTGAMSFGTGIRIGRMDNEDANSWTADYHRERQIGFLS